MKMITVHYNNEINLNKYFLAQNVEWQMKDNTLLFYNTLFDSVLFAKPKSEYLGLSFVKALENGCVDILQLIEETFDQPADSVYSLFVNKKIIE